MSTTRVSIESSGKIPNLADAASMSPGEVIELLQADPVGGLRARQARLRLAYAGPNRVHVAEETRRWRRLCSLLRRPAVMLVLVGTAAQAAALGGLMPSPPAGGAAALGLGIGWLSVNGWLGARRSRQAAEIAEASKVTTTVVRGGEHQEIDGAELVPGDLIQLTSGDQVPADARLIRVQDLTVIETNLTSSYQPMTKSVQPKPDAAPDAALSSAPPAGSASPANSRSPDLNPDPAPGEPRVSSANPPRPAAGEPPASSANRPSPAAGESAAESAPGTPAGMVYAGSVVVGGSGSAIVTATGEYTRMGRILALDTKQDAAAHRFTRPFERLGGRIHVLMTMVALTVGVLGAVGLARDRASLVSWFEHLMVVLALLVITSQRSIAGIPAEVGAMVGVKLREGGVLVRRLGAILQLGVLEAITVDVELFLATSDTALAALVTPSLAANPKPPQTPQTTQTPQGLPASQSLSWADGLPAALGDELDDDTVDEIQWLLLASHLGFLAEVDSSQANDALTQAVTAAGIDLDGVDERFVLQERSIAGPNRWWAQATYTDAVDDHAQRSVAIGWPEAVLGLCGHERRGSEYHELTDLRKQWWEQQVELVARQGNRPYAVAWRLDDRGAADWVLLGVVGLSVTPVPGSAEAVDDLSGAGVTPLLCSHNHPATVAAVLDEVDVDRMGAKVPVADQLDEVIPVAVARCAAEDKARLARTLSPTQPVAVGGHWAYDTYVVEDAPVGYAVSGRSSAAITDVADVVVADPRLPLIANAIAWARVLPFTARSFLRHRALGAIGLAVFTLVGVVTGEPLAPVALAASHIMWLATVVLALGLAVSLQTTGPRTRGRIMKRTPNAIAQDASGPYFGSRVMLAGTVLGGAAWFVYHRILGDDQNAAASGAAADQAVTAALSVLVVASVVAALIPRWSLRSMINPLAWGVAIVVVIVHVAIVEAELFHPIFLTTSLNAQQWADVLLAAGGAAIATVMLCAPLSNNPKPHQ